MADLPIIFSAPMIQALLREVEAPGTGKIMTRRLAWTIKTKNLHVVALGWEMGPDNKLRRPSSWRRVKPGDRLWVRENFYVEGGDDGNGFGYAADLDPIHGPPRLTPCIHMPRHLSRLTLIVTATKIERLQEISEEDAVVEGAELKETARRHLIWHASYRAAFAALWNSLHGLASWDANPEVVALTFTVHKQNIDALPKEIAA